MATRIASFTSNRGEFEFNASQFSKNIAHLIRKPQIGGLFKLLEGVAVEAVEVEAVTPKGRLYVRVVTKRGNGLTGSVGVGGKVETLIGALG